MTAPLRARQGPTASPLSDLAADLIGREKQFGARNYDPLPVVLTRGDPSAITNAVRNQIYAIDKNQPVTGVRRIDTLLNEAIYARPRFNLILFGVFAGLLCLFLQVPNPLLLGIVAGHGT